MKLQEAMTAVHPQIQPVTYMESEAPGAPSSWIDFILVSDSIVAEGALTEAGVLQMRRLNNSDHRLYMVEINLEVVLRLGPKWKSAPDKDVHMAKLKLNTHEHKGRYQEEVLVRWERCKVAKKQEQLELAVERWLQTRDHEADERGESDWGKCDRHVLWRLNRCAEAATEALTGAWRRVTNKLPSCQQTGGRRKDEWSEEYAKQARQYRTLTDVVSMWRRQYSKEQITDRVGIDKEVRKKVGDPPRVDGGHAAWKEWVSRVTMAAEAKRSDLHCDWRRKQREAMHDFIQKRSENFACGVQKMAIASWLKKAKRPPPIRSLLVPAKEGGGKDLLIQPEEVRRAADSKLDKHMAGGYGPSRWYEDMELFGDTQKGWDMRRGMAEGNDEGVDWEEIPEHLHYVVEELARRKQVESMGGAAGPEKYVERGCMQPVSREKWHEYWAGRKKGTAPGQSQLSVNLIWALQLRQAWTPGTGLTDKERTTRLLGKGGKVKGDKKLQLECLTEHCFETLRFLTNCITTTGMVPSILLREQLCLIDKVEGTDMVDLDNKRPVGLVEALAQATLGPHMRMIEDVWDDHKVINDFQSGSTRRIGCEVPLMRVTATAEYAYIHKTYLAIVWQDMSKAFDTLHRQLGIEMPMRRVGVPEKMLKLLDAFKQGGWCMVMTAWGPNERDWGALTGRVNGQGVNKLQPREGEHPYGFDPQCGSTQGGVSSTTVFKGYYDVLTCLQSKHCLEAAWVTGPRGEKMECEGAGYVDDAALTRRSQQGAIRAMEVAHDFFEVMDGKLNLDKTHVSIAECKEGAAGLKRLPVEGQEFNPKIHLPLTIPVVNKHIRREMGKAEKEREAAQEGSETWRGLQERLEVLAERLVTQVEVKDPYEEVKYLGVYFQPGLFYERAVARAKEQADAVASAMAASSMKPGEAHAVAGLVARQQAVYSLKCTSVLPEQMEEVDKGMRKTMKHKLSMCSKFPNEGFQATMYQGITDALVGDRVMMLLRLRDLDNSVASIVEGSLWRLQRWMGTRTPALQYKHAEAIGWEGTWMSTLAIWLSRTQLSVAGGEGIPYLTDKDACLVDLVPLEKKEQVAQGCREREIWRCSEIATMEGDTRDEIRVPGIRSKDQEWAATVENAYRKWESDNDMHYTWKQGARWEADSVMEHKYLGLQTREEEEMRLGTPRKVREEGGEVIVEIEWWRKRGAVELKEEMTRADQDWLLQHGVTCHDLGEPRRRSARVRRGRRAAEGEKTPGRGGAWVAVSEGRSEERLKDLCPVTPAVRAPHQGARRKENLMVVTERAWEVGEEKWTKGCTKEGNEWEMDEEGVVGAEFKHAGMTHTAAEARKEVWREHCDSIGQRGGTGYIYTYSDCSKIGEKEIRKVSYAWLTLGMVAEESMEGRMVLRDQQAELDFRDMRVGLWGGGVMHGPPEDMSTYRGEAYGLLATMIGLRREGWLSKGGGVVHSLDNKADANKYNKITDEEASEEEAREGADADLWTAIRREQIKWGGKFKVRWQRSHPERRKAAAAWTRHEHGNTQADKLADAAMEAFETRRERIQLVDPEDTGWAVLWQGELIVSDTKKTMLAALKADHMKKYLTEKRGWNDEEVGAFSDTRWVTKLRQMKDMANSAVVNKMLLGWLASGTVMARRQKSKAGGATASEKKGEAGGEEQQPEQQLEQAICRLCGEEPETNWHVHARCTHPEVVRERRRHCAAMMEAVSSLDTRTQVKGLLKLNWLLDDEGKVKELDNEEDMQQALDEWAPEIAARAKSVTKMLSWDKTVGKHGDELKQWCFRGLMTEHWERTLQELGVPRSQATGALEVMEGRISKSLPAVWKVFAQVLHEERKHEEKRRTVDEEVEQIFDTFEGFEVDLHIEEVKGWTAKTKRKWINKVKKIMKSRKGEAKKGSRLTSYFSNIPTESSQQAEKHRERVRLGVRRAEETISAGKRRRRQVQHSLRDCGWERAVRMLTEGVRTCYRAVRACGRGDSLGCQGTESEEGQGAGGEQGGDGGEAGGGHGRAQHVPPRSLCEEGGGRGQRGGQGAAGEGVKGRGREREEHSGEEEVPETHSEQSKRRKLTLRSLTARARRRAEARRERAAKQKPGNVWPVSGNGSGNKREGERGEIEGRGSRKGNLQFWDPVKTRRTFIQGSPGADFQDMAALRVLAVDHDSCGKKVTTDITENNRRRSVKEANDKRGGEDASRKRGRYDHWDPG